MTTKKEEGTPKEKHYRISLYPKEEEIEKPSYFEKREKPPDARQMSSKKSKNDEE